MKPVYRMGNYQGILGCKYVVERRYWLFFWTTVYESYDVNCALSFYSAVTK